jgi:signal transduction histidine kinase
LVINGASNHCNVPCQPYKVFAVPMPPEPSNFFFLDSVLEALPDPILVLRAPGECVWANRAANRLTQPLDSEPQAANRARIANFVADLIGHAKASAAETLLLVDPAETSDLPMATTANSAIWSDGEPVIVVTLRRDRGEATQLLANVSHELRTPLNAILGYTRLLLGGVNGEISRRQQTSLLRIDANAQHLLALINDLLDLSLSDAGEMSLRLSRFDLAALLREILLELEPLIAKAELPVYANWDAALSPIWSDRRKVKQIILNLMTNALKFGGAGEVHLELSQTHGEARVAVTDEGIGIAQSDHEKIFEDFRQLDSTLGRAHGGAGLGLAICRRFAALLGGDITVASALGKGATFTLVLPLEINDGSTQA